MTTTSGEPKLHGNPIADTAIRQPVFITMLMLLAVVIGLLAYTYLPVNCQGSPHRERLRLTTS